MPLLTLEVTALDKDPQGGPDWAELTVQLVGSRDQAILTAMHALVVQKGYAILALSPGDWALQIKTRESEVDAIYAAFRAFAEDRGIECDMVAGGFTFSLPLTDALARDWDQLMSRLATDSDPSDENQLDTDD